MEEDKVKKQYTCAVSATVDLVGGKWKTSILLYLKDGTLRFGQLQRAVAVSQKVLTQQLKELEQDGIVRRQVYAEVPPRVEYSLSPYGQTLQPVLEALYSWGLRHYTRAHPACAAGHPVNDEAGLQGVAAPLGE
ncbi:winged helix-turn-helix transcriptional regulator [Hymenobacter glacieicola]|uniref:Transcriptional regulator n=1 Tax=Hymenobacter glacieicola TaxID=1562124 RepID=A0ABQ1X629_9BACT|nr:helix-turn-helix domain-containing protein [Hymenobacter glacieicola]GGG61659.1 transcriptional regulator [Hymenobacter glacieicola]